MSRLLPLLFLVLLASCGSRYARRVPDKLVEKMPFEMRIELLEAENALALGVDRRDEAHNEVRRGREHLRRAKQRQNDARKEVRRAADPASAEVAALALAEARARQDYLRARQQVNAKLAEIEELALRCALARFELARLGAARKAKVEGSEKLDAAAFESQAQACEQKVADRRAALATSRQAQAEEAKLAWERHKAELARTTFDARASPWVD